MSLLCDFDAIFWDNDGVLMATEHLYYQSCAEALEQVGIMLSLKHFAKVSLGEGGSVFTLAEEAGVDAARREELRLWRNDRYLELLTNAPMMPGVHETLSALHGRVPMAIVTSCRRDHFAQMHRRSGLLGYFDFVLAREDYSRSKPNPEPYLSAAKRAGVAPERSVAVEDAPRGLKAAVAAGMRCVIMPGELNQKDDLSAATHRIETLTDLLPLFGVMEA